MDHYGRSFADQQEVLTFCADALIDTFAADSVQARAEAAGDPLHRSIAATFMSDALGRVEIAARRVLAAIGDTASLAALRDVMALDAVDTIPLRARIAEAVLSRRAYPCQ